MPSDISGLELLLYVATARRRVEWAEWKDACGSVSATTHLGGMSPSDCARSLEQLGHAEIALHEGAISVSAAPAVLARLPRAGLPHAVLCGGRSPQTEARLQAAATETGARFGIQACGASWTPAPRVFSVSADDPEVLARVAAAAEVKFSATPPAWVLAHLAGSLASYLASLTWRHEPEPAIPARDFDPETGLFGPHAPHRSTLRLINYFPRRFRPYHELRDSGRAARVDRDWGIWACLRAIGASPVVYDQHARAIATPIRMKLPRPLGRMLTLCSGCPPVVLTAGQEDWPAPSRQPHYVFTDIPANIAEALFDRLGQDPLQLSIPTPQLT